MTDPAILEHIASLPHARGTFKQLVRELGATGANREELEAALEGHLTIKHQSSNSHLIAQTACLDQANQA